jgi:hypothetical protein
MKLQTAHKKVVITNKDLEMEEEFSFEVKILSYRENVLILEANGNPEKESELLNVLKEIFVNSVISWTGVTDLEGNDLECNKENKELIYEYDTAFCQEVITKVSEEVQNHKKK